MPKLSKGLNNNKVRISQKPLPSWLEKAGIDPGMYRTIEKLVSKSDFKKFKQAWKDKAKAQVEPEFENTAKEHRKQYEEYMKNKKDE